MQRFRYITKDVTLLNYCSGLLKIKRKRENAVFVRFSYGVRRYIASTFYLSYLSPPNSSELVRLRHYILPGVLCSSHLPPRSDQREGLPAGPPRIGRAGNLRIHRGKDLFLCLVGRQGLENEVRNILPVDGPDRHWILCEDGRTRRRLRLEPRRPYDGPVGVGVVLDEDVLGPLLGGQYILEDLEDGGGGRPPWTIRTPRSSPARRA